MDVVGHEVILGPLQERVKVSFFDRGIVLARDGLAGSIFGAYEAGYRYEQVHQAGSGGGVLVHDSKMERPAHHIVGSAGRMLKLILGILDPERRGRVVAAPGSATTRFGLLIRGMVVGGPNGILLIPDGLFGLLPGGLLRLGLEQIDFVSEDGDAVVVRTTNPNVNAMRLVREGLSVPRFGVWWARMVMDGGAVEGSSRVLPVLWWEQSAKLQRGLVRLVSGGIRVESLDEGSVLACSGLVTFVLPAGDADPEGGVVRVQVRGREHTFWMLGGDEHHDALLGHLQACMHTAWPDDFDGGKWDACEGSRASARIQAPGQAEVVVRNIRVERTNLGLAVRHEQRPDVSLLAPQVRKRVFVELVQPRRRIRMRVIHRGVRREVVERDEPESYCHTLLPLGPGPEVLSSRRAYYRVEATFPVIVQLFDAARSRPVRSELVDLSATGMRVRVYEAYMPSEEMLQVRIAAGAHRKLKLRAEVLHATRSKDGTDIGLRFAKLNENVRTVVQREVLRLEREALNRPVDEELVEEGLPRIRPSEVLFEEPTLDYT